MRAGICTVQQNLTPEATNMVKQSIGLARRRGHAQVTPLHVASALLATPDGLLRRACLQSHTHPLQFRALELCFNVALNRQPAVFTSNPLLAPQNHHPSLSNALVAAFKRARAHQSRGTTTMDNQNQPILALKIELQHLIISILDDPSVSRVMREAGFSSTQVKTKLEQTKENAIPDPIAIAIAKPQVVGLGHNVSQLRNQNISNVLNTIVNKRRNTVVIGESVTSAEGVIKGVMDKFEKGEVPGDLRYLQFISLPLLSLRNLGKNEVEQKIVELKCLVKSYLGRGVVLYVGDLQWISEFWSNNCEQRRNCDNYCPVEHIIMEIKRLVCGIRETGKFFLMGISSFQTYYNKFQTGQPSLETIWELNPLTISVDNGLSLCLNSWPLNEADQSTASSSLRNKEFISTAIVSSSSSLPSWLQEAKTNPLRHKDSVNVRDEYKEHQFWISESEMRFDLKPDLLSNPNSSPNSASSSEATELNIDGLNEFKIRNVENMNILCSALEKKVPWQNKGLVTEIVSIVLECRSGTRKVNPREIKEDTWLLFSGSDDETKKKIATELARFIFGSRNSFVSIRPMDKISDSNEEWNKKRKRSYESNSSSNSDYVERLGEALNENPHRVFFMEDVEQLDYSSQKLVKQAIENGKISISEGETIDVKDAIIVLSCKSLSSMSCSRRRPKTCDRKDEISLDLKIGLEDYNTADESWVDIGIMEYVDKLIIFRSFQEL